MVELIKLIDKVLLLSLGFFELKVQFVINFVIWVYNKFKLLNFILKHLVGLLIFIQLHLSFLCFLLYYLSILLNSKVLFFQVVILSFLFHYFFLFDLNLVSYLSLDLFVIWLCLEKLQLNISLNWRLNLHKIFILLLVELYWLNLSLTELIVLGISWFYQLRHLSHLAFQIFVFLDQYLLSTLAIKSQYLLRA